MKQTAAKRRLRRHRTTRRHNKRQHEGGIGPVHAVGIALEAHHVQHSFFAMLSMATENKNLNVVSGIVSGLAAVGVSASVVATGGLAIVGLGILIFTAMAIRESIKKYEKLQGAVMALIQVLRKIQKTMMLCITMSKHYQVEINTHDLNVCLSKIYASLDILLTPEARNAVKAYARNYNNATSDVKQVEQDADNLIVSEENNDVQSPNRVSAYFSTLVQRFSIKFSQARFNSDAKEQELRELMNELTPFLTLLLSQTVLQFMVCQTSMITDGASEKLKIGNDAVKESCQYKDFQLSALLDSIMRITADLDREPTNRTKHIGALETEVERIRGFVTTNPNYTSFMGLTAKLKTLSGLIAAGNYDNIRANLDDLNTYDEAAFLTECNGQTQTQPAAIKSTASGPGTDGIETPDRSSPSPRFPEHSSEPLLDHGVISVEIGDGVSSIGSSNPPSRTSSTSSTTSNHPIRSLSNSSTSSVGISDS